MSDKIYLITLKFSFLNLLLSIVGVLSHNTQLSIFGWLLFFPPILWLLFIVNIFMPKRRSFLSLLAIWIVIDISILFLYIMFSLEVKNWANSRGIEVAMGVAYLPIIFPTWILINLIPNSAGAITDGLTPALANIFGSELGDAISIWLIMSGLASVQSLALTLLAFVIHKKRQARTIRL